MNIAEVRTDLGDALVSIDGLRVERVILDNPNPPCVQIYPSEIQQFRASFDGPSEGLFIVLLLAPGMDPQRGQAMLDRWLTDSGPFSVRAALDTVPCVIKTGMRFYGIRYSADAKLRYYAAELTVDVIA